MTDTVARFYRDLADWWPLFSAPEEYLEEAAFFGHTLAAAGHQSARTLLELGSGGGNNAWYLKRDFEMTLVEPASGMLEVSRRLNPDCEHAQGDMRTVRLGRQFDRVFVHDAVGYMTSERDLRAAIETAFVHCRPGGAVLFAPDYVRETFRPGTEHGGSDEGARGLRYLEWVFDPDPADTTYEAHYAFLLRDTDGSTRMEHDRHIEGLFSRDEWLCWLTEAGFEPSVLPFEHSELEPGWYQVFVGVRP